ncbi:MAG: potassium-transporting ATPase subunit KdpC [Deltaproteobacteria bacterium]|nr:potassium-transporting ATPase subunit KdpC [Deltaproteobacteria bacterium]
MLKNLYNAFAVTLLLTLLLCGVYPLVVYGLGQTLFKSQANGSLITRDGKVVGSSLIGQSFQKPEYFHGRPSAAGSGYDGASSSGSNLGPTSAKLMENLKGNIQKVLEENPGIRADQIPVDLVTTSGSGLDPQRSPASADLQAERVAKARQMNVDEVKKLIQEQTTGPQWGIFGESGVNVLQLNLALDALKPVAPSPETQK